MPELLSIPQAAKLLNISQRSLRRFIMRREINYVRVGNLYRFRPASIELFLQQREVKARVTR